jgi:hypothetical protein
MKKLGHYQIVRAVGSTRWFSIDHLGYARLGIRLDGHRQQCSIVA